MEAEQFEQLLSKVLDGVATEAERQEMAEALHDEEHRRTYVTITGLHLALRQNHQQQNMRSFIAENVVQIEKAKVSAARRSRRVTQPATPAAGTAPSRQIGTYRVRWLVLGAAALLLLALTAYLKFQASNETGTPENRSPHPLPGNALALVQVEGVLTEHPADHSAPKVVVPSTISSTSPWSWHTDATLEADATGCRLLLVDGSQLVLRGGTRLRLDAIQPPKISIVGDGESYFEIAHGETIATTATPLPVRFLVATAATQVEVTGTHFSVRSQNGSTEVAVSEGTVNCVNQAGHVPVPAGTFATILSAETLATIGTEVEFRQRFAWVEDIQAELALGTGWTKCAAAGLPMILNESQHVQITGLGRDDEQRLYAYLPRHGVYRSSDGGDSWTPLSTGLPADAGNIKANFGHTRTGEPIVSLCRNNIKDVDPGISYVLPAGSDTWQQCKMEDFRLPVFSGFGQIAVLSNGTLVAYDRGRGDLYRSTDNGRSFAHVSAHTAVIGVITDLKTNPVDGLLYAGTAFCGLYRSRDQGESWEALEGQIPDVNSKHHVMAITFLHNGDLLASENTGDMHDNWIMQMVRVPIGTNRAVPFRAPPVEKTRVSNLTAADGKVIFATTLDGEVYRSDDDGGTWITIAKVNARKTAIQVLTDSTHLYLQPSGQFLRRYQIQH